MAHFPVNKPDQWPEQPAELTYTAWLEHITMYTELAAKNLGGKRVEAMAEILAAAGHWVPTLGDGFTEEELAISITARYKHLVADTLQRLHGAAVDAYRRELFAEEMARPYKKSER